jgi:hypothetical protein
MELEVGEEYCMVTDNSKPAERTGLQYLAFLQKLSKIDFFSIE